MPAKRTKASAAIRAYDDCLRILNETAIPLDGYDRPEFGSRSAFAGYNIGRWQMAVEFAIRKAMAERCK